MVAMVRRGVSLRAVARKFHVSLDTVQRWVRRAAGERLDRVSWSDRSHAPHHPKRSTPSMEQQILLVRKDLRETSDLGEYGAAAIRAHLLDKGREVPSRATINRILERNGAFDVNRRVRRPPPPVGWHLPAVASRRADADSFDVIEDLVIQGGIRLEILTGVSLLGGLPVSWPCESVTAVGVIERLAEHWSEQGLPDYVQFDNDTRFQGGHHLPDIVGRVSRFCLQLGVTPVFSPPRETGFQAAVEAFNGRWQAKVWRRFHHVSLAALREQSARYIQAYRQRIAARIDAAPPRRAFPRKWRLDLQRELSGQIIFIRRTTEKGTATLMGRTFEVSETWLHRLVRAEVDFESRRLRFFGLRRKELSAQPLLREVSYHLVRRRFQE